MSSFISDDLFVDEVHLECGWLLSECPDVVTGQLRPVGASAFGDLFFERSSGAVEKLDVPEGGVHQIAANRQEFSTLIDDQPWQEQHLLSNGVALLKEGPVFALAPRPVFTGKIDRSKVMPLDAVDWNSICAQSLSGATPVAVPATLSNPRK